MTRPRHYPTSDCKYARESFTTGRLGDEYSFFECKHPDRIAKGENLYDINKCKSCPDKWYTEQHV